MELSPTDPIPTRIQRLETGFAVIWPDGHQAFYPFALLRQRCPCATCRDQPPRVVRADDPLKLYHEQPIYADDASLVGHYGFQICWNDGHTTGIYSFRYLRQLCPCDACQKESEAEAHLR